MTLKILCFEDNPQDQARLRNSFAHHDVHFKFFSVPGEEWNITPTRAQEISAFGPNMAIVDLMDDATGDTTPGYRVIRQLKESPATNAVPVVAWSRMFKDNPDGHRAVTRAEGFGAVPLQKSTEIPTSAERFLEAAHLL